VPRRGCRRRASRPDQPAGQIGEPVQVMLHCFVTHEARPVGVERIARGLEGSQPRDRNEADQAVALVRDKPAQRRGQFRAKLVQWQVHSGQRGHLAMGLPG
jgi:hypothetical protein